ncbi:MAG TPA: divalent-cation tolerance protein CutA [Acidiferrobacter sp.]|nr:divalent-cation tolerance protein CutA [Acidiferrobacter sp.]
MANLIVFSSCPEAKAAMIATALVEERLAACVNMVVGVRSVYHWRGQLDTATETLLIIKAAAHHYDKLEQRLRALHPYELPEIVAVPIERGYKPYLDWLQGHPRG